MFEASFDITKIFLHELLKQAAEGRLQLPDFQRDWIWDDSRIKSLLASISVSYPIGAIILLESGGKELRFQSRTLEGVALSNQTAEHLILDGQQRLTALYLATRSNEPVQTTDTRGKKIKRWYYIDIDKATDASDYEDAIVSVPLDKILKQFGSDKQLDLSTSTQEYKAKLFPFRSIFVSQQWRSGYSQFYQKDQKAIDLYNRFEAQVIKRFEQYQVPVIELKKQTPKDAICIIFERVNTGGVQLTVFELLTAMFAAENFRLRQDWMQRKERLNEQKVLTSLQSDDFLQAMTLLVTQERRRKAKHSYGHLVTGISCKRKDILNLTTQDYKNWAVKVEQGFLAAAQFLNEQMIFTARDLPYRTQLIPLAAIMVDLGSKAQTPEARLKIARWYWCGVFGELYGGTTETRSARDLPEVVDWIQGRQTEPSTIQESNFQASRLRSLRSRNSAAYKGLYALLMRDGCMDFWTKKPIESQIFDEESIEIHHIFPVRWCERERIERDDFNSVINKTAISARTNHQIGDSAPSTYLKALERESKITPKQMDTILRSHCISPAALRADDFWTFYRRRAKVLLDRIEAATGHRITRAPHLFRAGTEVEPYDEFEE